LTNIAADHHRQQQQQQQDTNVLELNKKSLSSFCRKIEEEKASSIWSTGWLTGWWLAGTYVQTMHQSKVRKDAGHCHSTHTSSKHKRSFDACSNNSSKIIGASFPSFRIVQFRNSSNASYVIKVIKLFEDILNMDGTSN
ncbi:hypothetical protein TYRP_009666, partial [Tyrophagus putrescentiae]